jgi:hypothetical protein
MAGHSRRHVLTGVAGALALPPASRRAAGAASTTWDVRVGDRRRELGRDVAGLPDGTYVLAGRAGPRGDGPTNALLAGVADGVPTWVREYGTDTRAEATAVTPATDAPGAVFAGGRVPNGTDESRGWLVAVDARGGVRWDAQIPGSEGVARTVVPDPEGGYVAAGRATGGLTALDGWLAGVDADGRLRWHRSYGDDLTTVFNAATTHDGRVYVGGLASRRNDGGTGTLGELASQGRFRWRRTYDAGGRATSVEAVFPTADGLGIAGTVQDGDDEYSLWLASLARNGTERWLETYSRSRADRLGDAAATPDGGTILVARSEDQGAPGVRHCWVVKVDATGDREWARRFGTARDDRGDAVLVTDDHYLVAGTTVRRGRDRQAWLLRRPLDDAPPGLLERPAVQAALAATGLGVLGGGAAVRRWYRES